jgi:hypothetical protein
MGNAWFKLVIFLVIPFLDIFVSFWLGFNIFCRVEEDSADKADEDRYVGVWCVEALCLVIPGPYSNRCLCGCCSSTRSLETHLMVSNVNVCVTFSCDGKHVDPLHLHLQVLDMGMFLGGMFQIIISLGEYIIYKREFSLFGNKPIIIVFSVRANRIWKPYVITLYVEK